MSTTRPVSPASSGEQTAANCAPEASSSCLWCGVGFNPRRGGTAQRFCSKLCRSAFHRACRVLAVRAVFDGFLPVEALKNASPAAYTLLSGAKSPSARKVASTVRNAPTRPGALYEALRSRRARAVQQQLLVAGIGLVFLLRLNFESPSAGQSSGRTPPAPDLITPG
jgi:hypothetical protein